MHSALAPKAAARRALSCSAVCLIASLALSGCFQNSEKTQEPEPDTKTEVSAPVKPVETISVEACAVKIESTLEARREAVRALEKPVCGANALDWYDAIDRLTETELEFPCMDASLREAYGVNTGSDVVFDDHAFSPEMASVTFGHVSNAICNKPYIAIARDTKRSLEKVRREPGFDSSSYIRNTLELVESLRGDLPQSFEVVQLVNGDYSQSVIEGEAELATYDNTSIWTFCRLPSGTLFSAEIDYKIYDGPGGLELLKTRLALADDWEGDDACSPDWIEADEEISDSNK